MNLETLQAVSLEIAAERSVDRILTQIVEGLVSKSNVALARVWLIGRGDFCETCSFRNVCPDQTRCLHLSASAGAPLDETANWGRLDGEFRRIPLAARKVGCIAANGDGILIEDVTVDRNWIAKPEWAQKERLRSFGGQPLIYKGEVLGVLGVFSREPIDQRAFEWLRTFADHAAISISSAKTIARSQLLLELNNSIVSHLALSDLLKAIAECIRRIMPDEFAGLVLHNRETDQLALHAIDTPNVDMVPQPGLRIPEESYPGLAFRSGEIVLRNRIDPAEFPGDPILRVKTRDGKRAESLCAVPLRPMVADWAFWAWPALR